MSSSSFFASRMRCASSIRRRVTTTFVFAMVVVLVQLLAGGCGVGVDWLALLLLLFTSGVEAKCDDSCDNLCIGV